MFIIFGCVMLLAVAMLIYVFSVANKENDAASVVAVSLNDIVRNPAPKEEKPAVVSFIEPKVDSQYQLLELNQENNNLRQQIADLENQRLSQDRLMAENKQLKQELQESVNKIRSVEGNIADHLKDLQDKYQQLKSEYDQVRNKEAQAVSEAILPLQAQIEQLQLHNQKLIELQQSTSQKNELLQYELIKLRAQVVGQTRIAQHLQKELNAREGQHVS